MNLVDRLVRRLAERPAARVHDPGLAPAAVALVLTKVPETLLLVRRAERDGDPWSGQMALPGGRKDERDRDLLATAVRETHEEVGLDLRDAGLIGQLDDLPPLTPILPAVLVRPYVFLRGEPAHLTLDRELAGAWWVRLERLLAPGVFGRYQVEALGSRMTRAGYRLEHGVVWGLTERILSPLLELIRAP